VEKLKKVNVAQEEEFRSQVAKVEGFFFLGFIFCPKKADPRQERPGVAQR